MIRLAPEHPARAAAVIDRWFATQFHDSPIARDTHCCNHAGRTEEPLIAMMKEV
ncbi:MAG: hypothetical protein JO081_14410 [Alphaproteobacteria bacterium]|nr:hypothetical protein [Alphaproteobacteria bacterium]